MAGRTQLKNKGDQTTHATAISSEFVNLKARLKKTWMAGEGDAQISIESHSVA